ncbi:MAG: bifunctional nuclease family protein [Anaerolineae bacterium]|nr:bifunctional nuclease family protein [Anaerolineales bacterium]MCQ3975947.1 bifunctional nuclease family protein [Anaerolineae bacterium]
MIEVKIDSIRVSLMSQHRVVVLKDVDTDRYLPIWIGPFEADAITIQLQGVQVARPLTHDLLKSIIDEMGATISHVMVSELKNDTFFARIVMDVNGQSMEIDARPSDAIALAVRANAPLFVAEDVMSAASIVPETSLEESSLDVESEPMSEEEEEKLAVFRDFIDELDLDDLGKN